MHVRATNLRDPSLKIFCIESFPIYSKLYIILCTCIYDTIVSNKVIDNKAMFYLYIRKIIVKQHRVILYIVTCIVSLLKVTFSSDAIPP